jgi:hypothetical protein
MLVDAPTLKAYAANNHQHTAVDTFCTVYFATQLLSVSAPNPFAPHVISAAFKSPYSREPGWVINDLSSSHEYTQLSNSYGASQQCRASGSFLVVLPSWCPCWKP